MSNPQRLTQSEYKEWRVLLITTLTSIATIIGSGILALPVVLWNTPMSAFLILFTIALFCFIGVVYATVELMQRVKLHRAMENCPENSVYQDVEGETTGLVSPENEEVTLFEIATRFLPNPFLRICFHVMTLTSFAALLVSYGLAAPQALYQISHNNENISESTPALLLFSYATIGLLSVIFFADALLQVYSGLTIVKGCLFTAVVAIVMMLPSSLRVITLPELVFSEELDWHTKDMIVPFLISCVALGALPNTMPVTFRLLPGNASKEQVARYRNAVIIGLVICYLLNVGWVIAVLQVVPRVNAGTRPTGGGEQGINLGSAFENGQISTVPLIGTLTSPAYKAAVSAGLVSTIGTIVNVFIVVSTSVSFFVMGYGCKNYVSGALNYISSGPVTYVLGHVLVFASLVVIIVWNPNGFITALTNVSSFSLNFQSGALVFVMLWHARRLTLCEDGRSAKGVDAGIVAGTTFFAFACVLVVLAKCFGIKT